MAQESYVLFSILFTEDIFHGYGFLAIAEVENLCAGGGQRKDHAASK